MLGANVPRVRLKYTFVPLPRVPSRLRRLLSGGSVCRLLLSAAALVMVALTLPAAPAAAAGSAALTVTMTRQPVAPSAGKHVSYKIRVHNNGPDTAQQVQVEFVTTGALTSPTWQVSTGRCMRSTMLTACLFPTMQPGASATATIGGILPKDLQPGTLVTNTATVTSDTTLSDPDQLVAHADFTMPGDALSPSPRPAPTTSASATTAVTGASVAGAAKNDQPGGRYRPLLMAVVAIGLIVAATALVQAVRLSHRPRP